MSVLETPRIYFKGEISWDPVTTNNYSTNYDEYTGDTILPQVANQVAAFRAQAIQDVETNGNWNPHGSYRSGFYNTAVSGFDLGSGLQTVDPFITAAANFTGMLVDLEPFGSYSSQLFFDSMTFGVDGGYRILAPRTSRITARYINFARNSANRMIAGVASVVWQTSFAKVDGLKIDSFDSAILKMMSAALEPKEVLGLTVRFNCYRTIYFDNPDLTNGSSAETAAEAALVTKLNDGGFQPNPARSLLVGVIGLWRKGEPAHEPGDRVLTQAPNSPLGSAYARIQSSTLTLDLSNSVPEIDKKLTKQDLGSLTVAMADPATKVVTDLGTFGYSEYDRKAYEATAGIVTVALKSASANAIRQDLQLFHTPGQPLLSELPLRAIPESPNLYLDQGESLKTNFQVYDRGQPATAKHAVTLFQMDSGGDTPVKTIPMTSDANGLLTVPIVGTCSGIVAYVPSFGSLDQPPSQGINTQVNTYMYVRTRPADQYIAQLSPTWDNVYTYVLSNWNAMAPCMDNWLMLNSPTQVKAYTAILKRLTDPAYFERYRFMPITRDMSPGQRTLLYKFLDAPSEDATKFSKVAAPHVAAPEGAEPHAHNFADLSRAMRRP